MTTPRWTKGYRNRGAVRPISFDQDEPSPSHEASSWAVRSGVLGGRGARRAGCSAARAHGLGRLLFHQPARSIQALEGPGVGPPALEVVELHGSGLDVGIVHVRDLEFPAPGRLERLDDVEHAGVIHVDARNGVVRLGRLGLLFDPLHPVAVQLGHTEALGIRDFFQDDARAPLLPAKGVDEGSDVVFDDVVPEDYDHTLPLGVVLGEAERLRDASLAFLVDVVDMGEAELLAVPEKAQEVPRVVASRNQEDVLDPGVDQCLDGVVDHRFVVDGQEMLVGDAGEREQPGSQSSRQDDAAHERPPRVLWVMGRAGRLEKQGWQTSIFGAHQTSVREALASAQADGRQKTKRAKLQRILTLAPKVPRQVPVTLLEPPRRRR